MQTCRKICFGQLEIVTFFCRAQTKHDYAFLQLTMVLSDRTFLHQAWVYNNRYGNYRDEPTGEELRAFRSNYGLKPSTCVIVWKKIKRSGSVDHDIKCRHLLWGLFFLKTYSTESIAAYKFNVMRKTYRRYLWRIIKAIASLATEVVSFNQRRRHQ